MPKAHTVRREYARTLSVIGRRVRGSALSEGQAGWHFRGAGTCRLLEHICLLLVIMTSVGRSLFFSASPTEAATTVQLAALSTSGNHILRNGVPFNFYGVNRDSLEWNNGIFGGCAGDGHFTDTDFAAMASWAMTAVRLPLGQSAWMGRTCSATTYAGYVDNAISLANAHGMYVILDLHWSDVQGRSICLAANKPANGDAQCWSGQQPMPDADSVTFWQQVASRYKNSPGVIFDLFNEPYIGNANNTDTPSYWNRPGQTQYANFYDANNNPIYGLTSTQTAAKKYQCWRSGGPQCRILSSERVTDAGHQVVYQLYGMQQLLDAVRGTGAGNLVLVAGLDWAYNLAPVLQGYAIHGTNIAYDTHMYVENFAHPCPNSSVDCTNGVSGWNANNTYGPWSTNTYNDGWNNRVGAVAAQYPVTASEFGNQRDCDPRRVQTLLNWLDHPGTPASPNGDPNNAISWTIWSWNVPGSQTSSRTESCSQPSAIWDWKGTPLGWDGTPDQSSSQAGIGQGTVAHDAIVRHRRDQPTPTATATPAASATATAVATQPVFMRVGGGAYTDSAG